MRHHRIALLMTMALGCSVIQHVPGGLRGINDQHFGEVTHMVAVGNTVQARALLAGMPPVLKSQAQWHYLKARNLLAQHRPKDAIPHLRIALQRAGNVPAIMNDLAAALVMTGQPGEAISWLQQIHVNSFKRQVANNMAAAMLMSGRTGEALNRFSMLTQSRPDDAVAWYNLSLAYLAAGRATKAVSSMQRAVLLKPDDRDILLGLAMACEAENNNACADLNYNKVVSLYYTDWKAHNDYGVFLARQGRFSQAKQHLMQAIQLNPKCGACLYNMGRMSEKSGHIKVAIAYYNRFLTVSPHSPLSSRLRRHMQTLKRR